MWSYFAERNEKKTKHYCLFHIPFVNGTLLAKSLYDTRYYSTKTMLISMHLLSKKKRKQMFSNKPNLETNVCIKERRNKIKENECKVTTLYYHLRSIWPFFWVVLHSIYLTINTISFGLIINCFEYIDLWLQISLDYFWIFFMSSISFSSRSMVSFTVSSSLVKSPIALPISFKLNSPLKWKKVWNLQRFYQHTCCFFLVVISLGLHTLFGYQI